MRLCYSCAQWKTSFGFSHIGSPRLFFFSLKKKFSNFSLHLSTIQLTETFSFYVTGYKRLNILRWEAILLLRCSSLHAFISTKGVRKKVMQSTSTSETIQTCFAKRCARCFRGGHTVQQCFARCFSKCFRKCFTVCPGLKQPCKCLWWNVDPRRIYWNQ